MFAGFGGGVVVVVDCDDVVWFFIVQQILDGRWISVICDL